MMEMMLLLKTDWLECETWWNHSKFCGSLGSMLRNDAINAGTGLMRSRHEQIPMVALSSHELAPVFGRSWGSMGEWKYCFAFSNLNTHEHIKQNLISNFVVESAAKSAWSRVYLVVKSTVDSVIAKIDHFCGAFLAQISMIRVTDYPWHIWHLEPWASLSKAKQIFLFTMGQSFCLRHSIALKSWCIDYPTWFLYERSGNTHIDNILETIYL